MRLQVLFVEDDPETLQHYTQELMAPFEEKGLKADIHPCGNFDEAFALATSPSRRYDMIVSDTYLGNPKEKNVAVMRMVRRYRKDRFCPLVVYSTGVMPPELSDSAFVVWADKARAGDIDRAIWELLNTGVPQLAHKLHNELENAAATYLWGFLEDKWPALRRTGAFGIEVCERLIRRRAGLQLTHGITDAGVVEPLASVAGLEYYIYPTLDPSTHSLGEVVRHRKCAQDLRVILTPHCHLAVQPGSREPRAGGVLAGKLRPVGDVLGADKLKKVAELEEKKRYDKIRSWVTPPSRQAVGSPDGRYWYFPAFLDIPHCFCDFQAIECLAYPVLCEVYEPIASLAAPFAESFQACFLRYYGAVGILKILPETVADMLEGDGVSEEDG